MRADEFIRGRLAEEEQKSGIWGLEKQSLVSL
jgi:hypothetical protein